MENKETYQYRLIEKLSFNRYGGTEDEVRAGEILMDEIKAGGGTAEYMPFQIPAYDLHACSARVVAPFEKELEVVPFGLSGELSEGGVTLNVRFIERSDEIAFHGIGDLSDSAVVINTLDFDMYKQLYRHHAAAFILIAADKWYNTDADTDLVPRMLRPKMLEVGKIPGFSIRSKDATDIIRRGAEKIHLELRQTETERTSRDIVAVIPGTEFTDESIVLTAHYDSVLVGTGSWDNASGAATLMYIYRHFLENPPRRTMRFIWCGSEEQGLLGSKAFVEQHEELMDEIKLCFNFDMCGTVIGANKIFLTGDETLKSFTDQLCREAGYSADFIETVHSSDSAPFCDKGIPAVGLSRGTSTAILHTRNDLIYPLSAKELYKNGEFAVFYISRVTNSAVVPIKKHLSDAMKDKLEKYFQRDKKAD